MPAISSLKPWSRESTRRHDDLEGEVIRSFGDEWTRFDQSALVNDEHEKLYNLYFAIFPWHCLPLNAIGFDMGCGSGRWARLVAPRVGVLNCIDASAKALDVARLSLARCQNVRFLLSTAESVDLPPESQDFGYSLGVLHHIADTERALHSCVALLKPGAPFLLYLYYRFDNRPLWFRALWRASEGCRLVVSRMPAPAKAVLTDCLAVSIYWPLARLARLAERCGVDARNWPLYFYRDVSFYTMRTDSRDRFGTALEQRFTRSEIAGMMARCGLVDVVFSDREPYWVAIGTKA